MSNAPSSAAGSDQAATSPMERRLNRRLLKYWEEQRRGRDFPALKDIDPAGIPDLWPSCFVLDTLSNFSIPYFHYFGPNLSRYSGVFLSGKQDWTATLLDHAVFHYRQALEQRRPLLIENVLTLFDGSKLLFRSVLLPCSDDQKTINYLLGAANGKVKRD
jgi:hypothetical protein